ncbi:OLC1v1039241C1 [Oldenlandia corymbosa var. corymbosa]|uniref:OLC1v1039241C1 n=1 Tax=Oldenlandia corymbosa var. corymbosa TaxID=529605 RepID=A0AAV1D294_OLDCO|nr:OLC1v1039241C1 [Oldenlandia corymbosa var. corymbosa]
MSNSGETSKIRVSQGKGKISYHYKDIRCPDCGFTEWRGCLHHQYICHPKKARDEATVDDEASAEAAAAAKAAVDDEASAEAAAAAKAAVDDEASDKEAAAARAAFVDEALAKASAILKASAAAVAEAEIAASAAADNLAAARLAERLDRERVAALEAVLKKASAVPTVELAAVERVVKVLTAEPPKTEPMEGLTSEEYFVYLERRKEEADKKEAVTTASIKAKFDVGLSESEMPSDTGSEIDKWIKYYKMMHYTRGFGVKWVPDNNLNAPILPCKFREDDNLTIRAEINELIQDCIHWYNSNREQKYRYDGRNVKNVSFEATFYHTNYHITFTAASVDDPNIEKSFVGYCIVREPPPFRCRYGPFSWRPYARSLRLNRGVRISAEDKDQKEDRDRKSDTKAGGVGVGRVEDKVQEEEKDQKEDKDYEGEVEGVDVDDKVKEEEEKDQKEDKDHEGEVEGVDVDDKVKEEEEKDQKEDKDHEGEVEGVDVDDKVKEEEEQKGEGCGRVDLALMVKQSNLSVKHNEVRFCLPGDCEPVLTRDKKPCVFPCCSLYLSYRKRLGLNSFSEYIDKCLKDEATSTSTFNMMMRSA